MSDELREFLKEQIHLIFNDKSALTRKLYMIIYSKIYDFCTRKNINKDMGIIEKKNYARSQRSALYNYIVSVVKDICFTYKIQINTSNHSIDTYNNLYNNFNICSKILDNIFEYFNRIYVKENYDESNLLFIEDCKILWFKTIIHNNPSFINKIINTINECRNQQSFLDTSYHNLYQIKQTLKSLIEIFVDDFKYNTSYNIGDENSSIYQSIFKDNFLKQTTIYYTNINPIQITDSTNINGLIDRINNIFNYENTLAYQYLDPQNINLYQYIKSILKDNLIQKNEEYISAQFIKALKSQNYNIQKLIHNLYLKYSENTALQEDEIPLLINSFKTYCFEYTNVDKSNKDFSNFKEYVEFFINNYKYFINIIDKTFEGNKIIKKLFDKIFSNILNNNKYNKDKHYTTDCIAKYIDSLIKETIKNSSYLDDPQSYDNILEILKYIDDKDYFHNYYKKYLMKRLLQNNYSIEVEKYFSNKLKELYSYEFTIKFNTIINDININEKTVEDYNKIKTTKVKIFPKVVTHSIWNLPKSKPVGFIPELKTELNAFEDFYKNKYKGRKLEWNSDLVTGEITTHCFKKKYSFNANHEQIRILLAFNKQESYQRECFEKDAVDILIKAKLLLCENNMISINNKYNNKKQKINLNIKKKKIVDKPKKELDIDRNILIQSTLVRIMKTKKTFNHNLLISECINQISLFTAPIPLVKKNIEKLIDKEYFERDENDKNLYHYLA